jgi:hypothetical protein
MYKSTPRRTSRLISAGIAAGVVAAAIISTPAYAAAPVLVLSSTNGPVAGANTITASSTTPYLAGVTTMHTTFSLATCIATYTSAASTPVAVSSTTVGNVIATGLSKRLSNYKGMITVPTLTLPSGSTSLAYKVCVYNGTSTSAELIGTATYTVATGTSLTGVLPTKGTALGGTTIAVSGTDFPTAANSISGTLGGVPLTSVTPVSATGFTAVAPPHAPGAVALTITTSAGTVTLQNAYTYANGIVVSPNTATNTDAANPFYLDVFGSNFLSYGFDGAAAWAPGTVSDKPRVYLVAGTYNPGASNTAGFIVGPSAECVTPVVVSDTELICALDLYDAGLTPATGADSGAAVPNGIYTVTVVKNGDDDLDKAALITAGTWVQTDVSSGATFTVADYN